MTSKKVGKNMEERNGNMLIKRLKQEVIQDMEELRLIYPTKRAMRQEKDAIRFLNMLNESTYAKCQTVGELKKKISNERNKLKKQLVDLDVFAEGHQYSLFENVVDLTPEKEKEMNMCLERLNEEIHWLHKCLGICSNQKYFK